MLILQGTQNQSETPHPPWLLDPDLRQCDGVPPACGGCTKFGRSASCSLSTRGARQARDYPTYLNSRIQRLQSHLERTRGDPSLLDGALGSADLFPGEPATATEPPFHDTPTSVDTLIADIGAVPILASSYSSTGDGPTLSDILLGAARKDTFTLSTFATPENGESGADRPKGPLALPRRDIAFRLVQHYIDQVYPRLPFFSIQGFWAQFNSVFSAESNSSPGFPQPQQDVRSQDIDQGYSTFTVLLVLAIASSSLSRSSDSVVSSQAQRLFTAALEYRESAVRPNTIVGVQSLLFLIQYATLNPSVLDAWYLIGVGMRSCIDLGLHRDPQPLDSVSPSLMETRRRLWWSIYSFDRSISLGCGRPTGISDCMIGARLPTFRIESMATEDQIQGYLQRYRALQIQSQIYDLLDTKAECISTSPRSIVLDLSDKLETWRRDNAPSHSQTLVESEWLMGKMLLYRPCQLVPQRTRTELRELWDASLRFSTLYRQLVESNGIFYVQIASEKIYWVGLAMLYSFQKLKSPSPGEADTDAEPIRQVDLWTAVQDVLFNIRTLSERWDDGNILARQFESASTRVISQAENMGTWGLGMDLPTEVEEFANYVSLTSIRAARENQQGMLQQDGELRQLMSDMLMDQPMSRGR